MLAGRHMSSSVPEYTAADESIRIRGARMHNLRNLDLDIPATGWSS